MTDRKTMVLRARVVAGSVIVAVAIVSTLVWPVSWKELAAYVLLGALVAALWAPRILPLSVIGMLLLVFGVPKVAWRLARPDDPHSWWQPLIVAGATTLVVMYLPLAYQRFRRGERLLP